MRKQGLMVLGLALVAVGVLGVLGSVLHIGFGQWFWPLTLIALGAWMLLRPRMLPQGVTSTQKLLGDVVRNGDWQVVPEDIMMVLGDAKLDLSRASIPDGETPITISHVLGDAKVKLAEGVGLQVESVSLITDAKILGVKFDGFATPVHYVSDGYESAPKRILLQVNSLLGDVRVERVAEQ